MAENDQFSMAFYKIVLGYLIMKKQFMDTRVTHIP